MSWPRSAGAITAMIAGLALLSLLAPFGPLHDPWSELVGRSEIRLAVARAGWLASVVLCWRLAAQLVFADRTATILATVFAPRRMRAGRFCAGALAALGCVVLLNPAVPWATQFAGGSSEPVLVALLLCVVDRLLSQRGGQALALGCAAAAVWWVPALVGAGDPLSGIEQARSFAGLSPSEALGHAVELPLAGLWVCAAWAVHSARREHERAIIVLAGAVVTWIAASGLLAAIGFAGLPRLSAPAGAIVCVLGAVGAVRLIAAVDGMRAGRLRPVAIAAAAAIAGVLAVQAAIRAAEIPAQLDAASADAEQLDRGLSQP